jgi:hypothetical protein
VFENGGKPQASGYESASLFRALNPFFQVTVFVIVNQLPQRCIVELLNHIAELGCIRLACGEGRAVNLAQRADQRVAVLFADLAVLVAVALV